MSHKVRPFIPQSHKVTVTLSATQLRTLNPQAFSLAWSPALQLTDAAGLNREVPGSRNTNSPQSWSAETPSGVPRVLSCKMHMLEEI